MCLNPNDKQQEMNRSQAESLMLELVGNRAIYDSVVCDETNNTARIDRNELYPDIAIEPVKAVSSFTFH